MSECTHDCSSCSADCSSRDMRVPANAMSSVKRVIAVVSGKGGVGKSTVTASLAVAMARKGRKVAILDADITGPSIPTAFGIHEKATGSDAGIDPAVTAGGIQIKGDVTVDGKLAAGGVEMTTHTHPGDSGGTTGGPQ